VSRVAIVLVNWNGWRDTLECLESLLSLRYPDFRIVVCDNGSQDDSLCRIRMWTQAQGIRVSEYGRSEAEDGGLPDGAVNLITLIRNGSNLGFAGGNNVGLRYGLAAGCFDCFWLLNNDTVVEPDALARLMDRMGEDRSIGICGSTVLHYHERDRIQALGGGHYCRWIGLPWHHGRFTRWTGTVDRRRAESWLNYIEGASMLVSRRFLEQVGLMNEEYFLYFEELDWAVRAKGRFRLGYAPYSIVYHKVGASIGTSSNPVRKSFVCDYYNIRNRIRFTRQYHCQALPSLFMVLLLEALIRLLCGKVDRAVMILKLMSRGGDDLERRP